MAFSQTDKLSAKAVVVVAASTVVGIVATAGFLLVRFGHVLGPGQFSDVAVEAVVGALVLAALCGGAGGYAVVKLLAPLEPISRAMEDAAVGRFAAGLSFHDRADEFGIFARVIGKLELAVREREAQRAGIEKLVACFGRTLEALSRQDLTYRLTGEVPPEYRGLQDSFNATLADLESAMKDIEGGAADITASTAEIHRAVQEMAQRTEREAAALEETSAAVNELMRVVEKSEGGARKVSDAAGMAQNKAVEGCDVAKNAVDAIRAIAQSSSEITQIIGVINDIAFQTNLLALNAGVEAARAGDAGRGFAVVASEVRELAQRSAEAAKRIQSLITHSEAQVENGVRLVEDSGAAFDQIVKEIATIYGLVTAIADSQREQTAALHEIEAAVHQLDSTTQQNAAMAEQSCAACDTMTEQAHGLAERVGRFRTSQGVRLSHAA